MLYQPSNMTPSSFASEGASTIDCHVSNKFRANIEGTSPVNAYQLIIYENTTQSKKVYDSGVTVLDSPFYGHDYSGNPIVFEITVPAYPQVSASAKVVNGFASGYKWTLSLWETYSSVTPPAASVISYENFFRALDTPSVLIDPNTAPATITSRENLWAAEYTSTTDIRWFQWTLCSVDGSLYTIIEKTDQIYQSADISFKYTGLVSGKTYAVRVEVVDMYGRSTMSNWYESVVLYSTVEVDGATDIQYKDGGILVDWSGVQYIEGEALYKADDTSSDHYDTNDHELHMQDDTYVLFESSSTFNLDLDEESAIAISVVVPKYTGESVTIFAFESDDESNGNPVYSRKLEHYDRTVGVMPDDESLNPDNDPIQNILAPDPGVGGYFKYTITSDGTSVSFIKETSDVDTHRFIVYMREDSLEVVTLTL